MIRRALFLAIAAALFTAAPVAAHDDRGELTLLGVESISERSATFEVFLIYSGDKEPVTDAALTAVASLPGGETAGPAALAPVGDTLPGRYRVELTFPTAGTWSIAFNALTPRASLTIEHVVGSPEAVPTPDTAEAPRTTSTIELVPVPPNDDEGSLWVGALVGGVAAVAVAAIVLLARRRRRRR